MSKTLPVNDNIVLEMIDYHHAEHLYELVTTNRHYLRQWLPWVDHMRSVEDFRAYIYNSKQRMAAKMELGYVIMVRHVMVGRLGLYHIDHHNKCASIGYWLDQQHQGQGILTNCVKELVAYSFTELGLNRIEIRCGTENFKSQAIPQRLNFKKEGTIRQAEFVNNQFIDLFIYSLIKEEWQAAT